MGSPPPTNFPTPSVPGTLPVGASLSAHFATPAVNATVCGITFAIPSFVLGFSLSFGIDILLPKLPKPNLHFKLSCDLNNPIDVSGGIEWGGGREPNAPPDPDDDENDPTY